MPDFTSIGNSITSFMALALPIGVLLLGAFLTSRGWLPIRLFGLVAPLVALILSPSHPPLWISLLIVVGASLSCQAIAQKLWPATTEEIRRAFAPREVPLSSPAVRPKSLRDLVRLVVALCRERGMTGMHLGALLAAIGPIVVLTTMGSLNVWSWITLTAATGSLVVFWLVARATKVAKEPADVKRSGWRAAVARYVGFAGDEDTPVAEANPSEAASRRIQGSGYLEPASELVR